MYVRSNSNILNRRLRHVGGLYVQKDFFIYMYYESVTKDVIDAFSTMSQNLNLYIHAMSIVDNF